jgi:hypothetical protein
MNAIDIEEVVSVLGKTAKRNENNVVKDAVVEVAYAEACKAAFVEHLESSKRDVKSMIHLSDPQMFNSRESWQLSKLAIGLMLRVIILQVYYQMVV